MARKRKGAGALNHLVTFQRRVVDEDDFGNERGDWQDEFTVPARLEPRFGSRLSVESDTAARLQAMQPYNLTVRGSTTSRQVTAAWRAYDARVGLADGNPVRVFDIKTVVNPDEQNAYIEMLVVEGSP